MVNIQSLHNQLKCCHCNCDLKIALCIVQIDSEIVACSNPCAEEYSRSHQGELSIKNPIMILNG